MSTRKFAYPPRIPELDRYSTADTSADIGLTNEARARLFAAENPEQTRRMVDMYRRGQLSSVGEVLAELRAASPKVNTSRDLRSRTLPAIAAGLLRIWQSEEESS